MKKNKISEFFQTLFGKLIIQFVFFGVLKILFRFLKVHDSKVQKILDILKEIPNKDDSILSLFKKSFSAYREVGKLKFGSINSWVEEYALINPEFKPQVLSSMEEMIFSLYKKKLNKKLNVELLLKETDILVEKYTFGSSEKQAIFITRSLYNNRETYPEILTTFEFSELWEEVLKEFTSNSVFINGRYNTLTWSWDFEIGDVFYKGATGDNFISCEQYNSLEKEIEKIIKSNLSRSYIILGKPGAGKSSFVFHLCEKYSIRAFKISSEVFSRIEFHILKDIIQYGKFKIIILDDFDRMLKHSSEMTLSLLESLKTIKDINPILLATANSIEEIDKAYLRPGRFERIVEILPLSKEERIHFARTISPDIETKVDWFEEFIDKTEGFTQAYLKEFLFQLTYLPKQELIKEIEFRKKTLK